MSDDEVSDGPMDFGGPQLPEGVKKDIIKQGDGWRRPKAGDELTVHYVGTLESDGSEFDSSRERDEPITLNLGKGEVIKGWEVGLATMRKGEIAKFTLQPQFAYGEAGMAPKIPPKAVLVFEIELISWVGKDDLFNDGGVIKAVLTEGEGFNNPKKGQEVRVSIKATASGGKVLEDRSLVDYVLGSNTLGPMGKVVDKALEQMSKEEKVMLHCEKDYVFRDEKVKIELLLDEIYETSDVSVLKDGSVMKKQIQDGHDYDKPKDGYKACLKVESATDGSNPIPGFTAKDLRFVCGDGELCDALEGVVVEMKLGERAIITADAKLCEEPKLGLTDLKCEKVVFTVELLEREKAPNMWDLHYEDKIDLARERKDMGAKLFKEKRFILALDKYKKVIDLMRETSNFSDDCKRQAADLKKTSELNKAACYLQLGDPTSCLSSCNEVLQVDPQNVKALFRRGKAHFQRGENADAMRDLERVVEMDPTNNEAKGMMPKIRQAQKIADKESKNTFAKMCEGFGKIGSGREKKPVPKPEPKVEEGPKLDPNIVAVTFKMDIKLEPEEQLCVVGQIEQLGSGDDEKAIPLRRLPPKWEPPTGSGRAPPEFHWWEGQVEIPQDCGRVEYVYLVKGPAGTLRKEDGDPHVLQIAGMGGCRQRTTNMWRTKGD